MRIRAKINKTKNRKSIEKINKTQNWFFEKFNKTNKPLARITKKKEKGHKLLIPEIKEGMSLQTP